MVNDPLFFSGTSLWVGTSVAVATSACASSGGGPPPLSYLAVERPQGAISVQEHKRVEQKFDRGGWYFLNFGFRPAPDIAAYLLDTQAAAGSDVLLGADATLNIPFAFDILLFGYNAGTDYVSAKGE